MADEITLQRLAEALADGETVIDVREHDEYLEARVPGVRLVPLGTLPDSLETIPNNGVVHVICRSGARSQRAADFLLAHGYRADSVAGGTIAWIQHGNDYETGAPA